MLSGLYAGKLSIIEGLSWWVWRQAKEIVSLSAAVVSILYFKPRDWSSDWRNWYCPVSCYTGPAQGISKRLLRAPRALGGPPKRNWSNSLFSIWLYLIFQVHLLLTVAYIYIVLKTNYSSLNFFFFFTILCGFEYLFI